MKKDDCIFCKITAGEIPSATLYEDEEFRVFLDLGPASKGHCLIVPKDHYENLAAMPDELLGRAFALAKKMAVKMQEVTGCDGYNIVQNNGLAAGQTVFHFHIHLIPRNDSDGVGVGWKPGELTDEVKEELLKAFA